MGVPSYFSWIVRLSKRYGLENMVHPKLINTNKRLYLDFNCGIHQVAREANVSKEIDIINNAVNLIDKLIEHVKPTDLVYISIDGSVPMGKCKQQRYRRFKSVKESVEIDKIYKKWGIVKPQNDLDFNMISPGTKFMAQLSLAIKNYIEQSKLLRSLNIELSDSLEPGEGEHKIMQHVKNNPPEVDDQIVIYGLDADLIFLSLGLHHHKTFLIRENLYNETIQATVPEYLYLNIGELRDNIIKLITQKDSITKCSIKQIKYWNFEEIEEFDPNCLINDYIFYNFFLGNDFCAKLYCLSIRNRGCEMMLQIYRYCLRKCQNYLILRKDGKLVINQQFINMILDCLLDHEKWWWNNPRQFMQCAIDSSLSQLEQDLERFKLVDKYLQDLDVKFEDKQFKQKYYSRLFKLSPTYTLDQNIAHICRKYWSTMKWTLEYYINGCVDWNWYYPYEYAPLVEDIIAYSKTINETPFKPSQPMEVYHQLMVILPPSSFDLLPPIYRRIIHYNNFKQFFPTDFDYYYYGHHFTWECPPKIPVLNSKQTDTIYKYLTRQIS